MTWRVKGLYVQICRGISSSCWHLKSESPAVSGISMKEASERTDNNSAIICFDFRGKLRVCWPGSICNNARLITRCPWEIMMRSQFQKYLFLVTDHYVVKIGPVHMASVITHRSLRIYRSPQTWLLLWTSRLRLITTSNALIFQEVAIPQGVWIICGH